MTNFSIIILTYNEENNIKLCLEKAFLVSKDIFIVDSFSTDKTLEISSLYPVQILQNPFKNYADQRNWAQNNCPIKTEWVLHIDAGEILTSEFITWINNKFEEECTIWDGFIFSRRVYFLGKWIKYGAMYPNYHLRLFKKSKGYCENKSYDQHFVVAGKVKKLPLGIDIIDNSGDDITEFIDKHNRWAVKESNDLLEGSHTKGDVQEKITGNVIEQKRFLKNKFYYRLPLIWRSFFFFFYRYFLYFGFLDGKIGFIYHFLQCLWFRIIIDGLYIQKKNDY
jgi:glycosyltransferase involved in cell wall biosynthesis